MSTILDALRKVQRERDRDSPDLRHAIADRPKPTALRGPGNWIAVASLVLLVVGASAYLFLGRDPPGAAIPEVAEPAGAVASLTPQPGAEEPERTLKENVREALRKRMTALGGNRGRQGASARRRAKRPSTAQGIPRGPSPVEDVIPLDEMLASEPADPEPVALASTVPPPDPVRSEPVRVAAVEPVVVPPPAPAPRQDPPPRVRPSPRPAPERAPAERPPAAGPAIEGRTSDEFSGWPTAFPDLQLESVRWHPDSSRREARLLVDATRSVDAREGDIVRGVAVHRIDPGAVELRLGDTTRLLRIGQ